MNESAPSAVEVAERWLERVIASYPAAVRSSLASKGDRFRNPAGYALEENLRIMARELMGAMDHHALEQAIDGVVRLRAVQDFTPSEALEFVAGARAAIADVCGAVAEDTEQRIGELARMAVEQYTACRAQIAELRAKELRQYGAGYGELP